MEYEVKRWEFDNPATRSSYDSVNEVTDSIK